MDTLPADAVSNLTLRHFCSQCSNTDEKGPFGAGGAFRGGTFLAVLVKSITSSLATDEEGCSGAGDTFLGRTFRADLVPHDSGGTVKAGVLRG